MPVHRWNAGKLEILLLKGGSNVNFQCGRAGGPEAQVISINSAGNSPAELISRKSSRNLAVRVSIQTTLHQLVTGSQYDAQFGDPNRAYYFGFSAFDNAQVRHAMSAEPLKMIFAK